MTHLKGFFAHELMQYVYLFMSVYKNLTFARYVHYGPSMMTAWKDPEWSLQLLWGHFTWKDPSKDVN